MAGEAIVAFVSDPMFSVQLREAAGLEQFTITLASTVDEYRERLSQVSPALVVLDIASVGNQLETLVTTGIAAGARVVAYGSPAHSSRFAQAEQAGCVAVYPSAKFKMETREILAQWMDDMHAS